MYLLDTTIFSFIIRNDPVLKLYADTMNAARPMFLSAMTVCELQAGAQIKGWGDRRTDELQSYIDKFTVLPIDTGISTFYGRIIAVSRELGKELSPPDALIAATALQFDLTLLSHDKDMIIARDIGVDLICKA